MEKCFFPWCQRHEKGVKLATWTEKRIDNVRNVSKQRADDIESRVENHIKNGNGSDVTAHHLCTKDSKTLKISRGSFNSWLGPICSRLGRSCGTIINNTSWKTASNGVITQ